MQVTAGMLRKLAPKARDEYISAFVDGADVLSQWGFAEPIRFSALLATACHETGGLTIVRENGNYTTAARIAEVWPNHFSVRSAKPYVRNPEGLFNFIYGPSSSIGKNLGNTQPDDGFKFRGGGLLQTTGRDNYTRIGKAIGVDLANHPELIEDAAVSLQAACWELSKLTQYCDMGERGWKAVCNGVNRGNALSSLNPIGWSDRQIWYSRCCDALGIIAKVADDMLRKGDQGPLVGALQERLAALGYAVGRTDNIYGDRMEAAVLAFQKQNGLVLDGIIGPETRTALNSDAAKRMPVGERANATVQDLKNAGSTTIAVTQTIKATAKAVGGVSVVTGVANEVVAPAVPPIDVIATTKDVITEVNSWKVIVASIEDAFTWATSHWWVFAIVVAFAFYKWGDKIEFRRLLDHQSGANLGR